MPALMTGLVDGQENPLNNIIARKMYEANKYLMLTGHMESVLATFVNEEAWQAIPEEDRAIMEDVLRELAADTLDWYRESEAEEIAFLKEQGVTVIDEAAGLDLDAFREGVRVEMQKDYPGWQDYLDRINAIE
jgi:TRAP-type C4-dicarboxylate transport system substrate-binding protein